MFLHQTGNHEHLTPAGLVPVERVIRREVIRSTDARSVGTGSKQPH